MMPAIKMIGVWWSQECEGIISVLDIGSYFLLGPQAKQKKSQRKKIRFLSDF